MQQDSELKENGKAKIKCDQCKQQRPHCKSKIKLKAVVYSNASVIVSDERKEMVMAEMIAEL
jgi:hypothetical protein